MNIKLSIKTILVRDSNIESVSLFFGKKPKIEKIMLTESNSISNTRNKHFQTNKILETLVKY